jgi:hypothetical protein
VNQTSPPGDQARPWADAKVPESFFTWPDGSTAATEPVSSPNVGWSMKAIRVPSGETRGWLTQPAVSYRTFPAGYSSLIFAGPDRTIARLLPSGDQSAHSICFKISRGAAELAIET